ncbi:copper amine oxidase N-terminal domain-containing protein [Paenibacillus chungangensis]|uniref:Copper amine oxidase N-terminal domain-containing protein n=1 Tax=Paenibacillus chungangensis TaxID=696535 RepID=A0ABW3HKN9_9BACL
MNKKTVTVLSSAIIVSMMATSAFAAPGKPNNGKGNMPDNSGTGVEISVQEDSKKTVKDSVYGGPNGSNGLLQAYENVKDKPAGERIAFLLKSKYNIEVSEEEDLDELVDTLEEDGQLDAAAEAQAEIILDNLKDIKQYNKLSKLQEKMGKKGIKTYVNGKQPEFDVPPIIVEGRTLVPFRAIAEALNAEVEWDAETRTVTVMRDDMEVKLTLGSYTVLINGEEYQLDVPAQIKDKRTLVPIRFLSEALKADVEWDAETTSIIVIDESQLEQEQESTDANEDAE